MQLDAFARRFAADLRPGDVVALSGSLGAGKTTLVRALVRALHGSDAAVSSPTFVFRQTYVGTPTIEHIDLYRLDDAQRELPELGLDDALSADRIVMVEWPERAGSWLPAQRIELEIAGAGDGPRTVRVRR
jgi:tRNA threonylcarbamoyl adenosine modification protein YjeE